MANFNFENVKRKQGAIVRPKQQSSRKSTENESN